MSGQEQGALVISLDFELHWGVRDHRVLNAGERNRLLKARAVIPGILKAFGDHDVRATWATVGLLFAHSREEAQECRPRLIPKYAEASLNAYVERTGKDEADDPFHFAPSLIREIAAQPGQEVGSHSYSHYYALEAGQGEEEFKGDVASAKRIAESSGYRMRSYVFPRNQVRRNYLPILRQAGFATYRGTEPVAAKAPVTFQKQRKPWSRALRLTDAYWNLNGAQTVDYPQGGNPAAVDASRYLRPFSPALRLLESTRLKRIASAMKSAARENKIFHLWWHPEDFAGHPEQNLDFLRKVLEVFGNCRREYGMVSRAMGDLCSTARETAAMSCGVSR